MQKSKIIPLFLLLILCLASNAQAATKNVTITWSMQDTSNVTGYKMYYAYNGSMTNKQFACDTDDGNATTLTCNNIELDQSPVYFEIAAVTANGELTSSPGSGSFTQAISPVQGFQIVMEDASPPSSTPSYRINFQPRSAPIPNGFSPDYGDVFSESRGYGWEGGTNSTHTRDTNNPASKDQAYDTLISVNEHGKWELIIPNGTYSIKIVLGDADWPDGTSSIQAEGKTILSGETLTDTNKWIEREGTAQVVDGRLTLTFAGSTTSKLCFLEVTKLQ